MRPTRLARGHGATSVALGLLAGCGGSDGENTSLPTLGAATPATLASCSSLATSFSFASTTITAATDVAAGTLTVA
jgi:hypothetical protein